MSTQIHSNASRAVAHATATPGRLLAPAFAAAGLLWACGYVALTAPGQAIGEALFAAMAVSVALGGAASVVLGASCGSSAASAGARTGALVGVINLLIVGSLAPRNADGQVEWLMLGVWAAGMLVGCAVLGAIGGVLVPAPRQGSRAWMDPTALFAAVSAALIFGMLVTGGIVTGEESGLAVPDWPNSFGHNMILLPLSAMKADHGVFYEHAHRLSGMLVGLTSIALVIQAFRSGQRAAVRNLAVLAVALVCVQGLLGGLRVTGELTLSQDRAQLAPSTAMAIVHGVNGQVVFAIFCVIAAMTSRAWNQLGAEQVARSTMGTRIPTIGLVVVLLQVTLGAIYRHVQVVNPETLVPSGVKWALHAHLGVALLALAAMVMVGIKAMRDGACVRAVKRAGMSIHALLLIQIVLGTLALVAVMMRKSGSIPAWEVAVTTAHQVCGAAIVAAMALVLAWALRMRRG